MPESLARMHTHLLVRKDKLQETSIRQQADVPLAPGQVRVRIDLFALTSNNITYAAFGEAMRYWDFYPSGALGWGVIPVWGFGSVVQSDHPGVAVGERLYGYFPMADSVLLAPGRLSVAGFTDTSAHREPLARLYNHYVRCSSDPFYSADTEPVQALLRPLFTTAWLIDDFLAESDFFGARVLLLSSASSKTAYATAFALAQRVGIEVAGLTSAANRVFCEGLGCYTRVLTYEQLNQIGAPDLPCVFVDFAGNAELRRAVHTRQTGLRYSASIGGTHITHLGGARDLPGPKPVLFFAPAQAARRHAQWGGPGLEQRLLGGWRAFLSAATDRQRPWLVVQRHIGAPAVSAAYQAVLAGQGDPRVGHVLAL